MSNNIKVLFWLNRSKTNKKGLSPIMLRISHNNERKQISTGFNVKEEKWDTNKNTVKGKDELAIKINDYLRITTMKIHEVFNEMLKDGDIYLENLMDKVLGKDANTSTLMQLANFHLSQIKSKIGNDYALGTFKKYTVTLHKLQKFLPFCYKKPDIRLKDLSLKFIADFDHFMKTELGNDHNTTIKHCKNLKAIINNGIINGWIEKNPFFGFKTPYRVKEKVYLNAEELKVIQEKTFKIDRLTIVRDLFVFQCFTALSYQDMANLKGKDVTVGIDGSKWIIIYRQKTNIRCGIPLLPAALKVIEHYNPDYMNELSKQLLPVYSNQKFNSYLKEIADFCGINKELSSHAGRRTFSTTVALANGITIETIRSIIGHAPGSKITHQYAVVTDLKVSEEMNKLKKLL